MYVIALLCVSAGEACPEMLGEQQAPLPNESGGYRAEHKAEGNAKEGHKDKVTRGRLRGDSDTDCGALFIADV